MEVDTPMQAVPAPAAAVAQKRAKAKNTKPQPRKQTASQMVIDALVANPTRKGYSTKKIIDMIKSNNPKISINELAVKKALKQLIADKKVVKPAGVGLSGSFKISPEESARVKKATKSKAAAAKKKAKTALKRPLRKLLLKRRLSGETLVLKGKLVRSQLKKPLRSRQRKLLKSRLKKLLKSRPKKLRGNHLKNLKNNFFFFKLTFFVLK